MIGTGPNFRDEYVNQSIDSIEWTFTTFRLKSIDHSLEVSSRSEIEFQFNY